MLFVVIALQYIIVKESTLVSLDLQEGHKLGGGREEMHPLQ